MAHRLESKPVARSELDTAVSSEDDGSIDHALEARLRDYFEPQHANGITQSQDSEANRVRDASSDPVKQNPNDEGEGYSFRLFARPVVPGLPEGEVQGSQKISLRSPSPASGGPGFVNAERPATYYFTGETSEERADQYRRAAVSGEQLLQGLKTRWPGFEMPWRVTILKSTRSMATSSFEISQTSTGKRRRIGKKRRIAIRKQKAAEREKRKRKNREKKVKKRQKDKLKELEVGQAVVKIP